MAPGRAAEPHVQREEWVMTKAEAKRRAAREAVSRLQGLLDAGWPFEVVGNGAPPESEADLQRMLDGMERLIDDLYRTYRL